MLFSIFTKKPYSAVPVAESMYQAIGFDRYNPERNWECEMSIFSPWSEVERPEYSYKYNKDGFRSSDFEENPEVITLGCSITFGQGLPVEHTWPHIFTELLNSGGSKYQFGNISYVGGSIMKCVSAFFSVIKMYQIKPKYVIANFPNFERFWFMSTNMDGLYDYHLSPQKMKVKAVAPYDYSELVPIEQAYFSNLEYIKLLETFCKSLGIKLLWSTWTTNLTMEMEQFLVENFDSYIPDSTRTEWKPNHEYFVDAKNRDELVDIFRMKNYEKKMCHIEFSNLEDFDFAYDYHKNPGNPSGSSVCWPHSGMHRHMHWAEMYHSRLIGQ
jgi:hypothetical protein